MPNQLPESSELDIRDYLYIDRQRVGSLLAQLIDGLPEERSNTSTRSRRLDLGIRRVAALGKDVGENSSQTLALADLHVSQLEEAAEALGLLGDVSDKMQRRKFWLRGRVRADVRSGMLIRVTAPTQLSDMASITAAFRRINDALSDSPTEMDGMLDALEALYGESITVSVRTAGAEDFEVGFVGEIPHAHEFGPMRRDLLLSQVGAEATDLTTLMQISAVPTERDHVPPAQLMAQLKPRVDRLLAAAEGSLDRSALDQFIAALGGTLTSTGFVAAPRWPAIGIVPLAVYRAVQRVPLDTGEQDDETA